MAVNAVRFVVSVQYPPFPVDTIPREAYKDASISNVGLLTWSLARDCRHKCALESLDTYPRADRGRLWKARVLPQEECGFPEQKRLGAQSTQGSRSLMN